MAIGTVRQGGGAHTTCDELFAKINGFVYIVKDGIPDLGNVRVLGKTHPAVEVEVINLGGSLVEVVYFELGGRQTESMCGRCRPLVR
ncbi:MAG: hypothetical protein AAB574_03770 [Patescibacteria group bacterium]